MSKDLTKEQVTEWKQNSVTSKFMDAITARREEVKEAVVSGFIEQEEAIGMAKAFWEVLNWTYEDD